MLDTIPNNVNLEADPKLQRALLRWQPDFLNWWREMGPEGFQEDRIYLRTAVGRARSDTAAGAAGAAGAGEALESELGGDRGPAGSLPPLRRQLGRAGPAAERGARQSRARSGHRRPPVPLAGGRWERHLRQGHGRAGLLLGSESVRAARDRCDELGQLPTGGDLRTAMMRFGPGTGSEKGRQGRGCSPWVCRP